MGRVPVSLRRRSCVGFLTALIGVACACGPAAEPARTRPSSDAAGATKGDTPMTLTIRSSAFADQARIPKRFTGDGEDVSPELSWSGVPAGAKELALICDDPDAPTPEPWVHWVIYKIPTTATALRENVPKTGSMSEPAGSMQGVNSWGAIGYRGPAPPRGHGVHHYHFKLYAVDSALNVAAGVDKKKLLSAIQGHIVAQGELVGTYER